MKTIGRTNLKTTSMRGDNATIHRMLSVSLLGVLVFSGCNKTPPAETSASSSPPAEPAAAQALDQPPPPAASVPSSAVPAPAASVPRSSSTAAARGLHRTKRYYTYRPAFPGVEFKNE